MKMNGAVVLAAVLVLLVVCSSTLQVANGSAFHLCEAPHGKDVRVSSSFCEEEEECRFQPDTKIDFELVFTPTVDTATANASLLVNQWEPLLNINICNLLVQCPLKAGEVVNLAKAADLLQIAKFLQTHQGSKIKIEILDDTKAVMFCVQFRARFE